MWSEFQVIRQSDRSLTSGKRFQVFEHCQARILVLVDEVPFALTLTLEMIEASAVYEVLARQIGDRQTYRGAGPVREPGPMLSPQASELPQNAATSQRIATLQVTLSPEDVKPASGVHRCPGGSTRSTLFE